jgi:hypothetical protein
MRAVSSADAAMTAKVNGACSAVFQNCRRGDKFREQA